MPILQELARKKVDSVGLAFANYRFIFILHFLTDLLGFMEAFRQLGMSWEDAQFLYKPYLYRFRERIARQLENEKAGVNPLTPNSLETIIQRVVAASRSDGRKIIIVEDGGYIVPLIHQKFLGDLDLFQGAVEQTTKGINADIAAGPLKIPLLSVASARVKQEKESPEIALTVWDNVRRLLAWSHHDLRKPKVLIVGYGSIGKHLASHLRRVAPDSIIKIFDGDANKRKAAADDGFIVDDNIRNLIEREHGLFVIGATGATSIREEEILALENDSVLISASSDQNEIGRNALGYTSMNRKGEPLTHPMTGEKVGDVYKITENRNEITLLAEGYPINFWNTESMPIKVSQVAMVPLFLSTVAIATRADEIDVGQPNSEFVDALVEEEHIFDRL
jgi:adenosylhomocysteinase